ncbi:hypothetical protein [Gloeocapsopsis dulcis]|nr:hypothetical protein [Gloeocapsopsis dulcis]WNN91733.1 hypothetical protein P0S91_11975 [Gloeocapsopsis dulcis]
MFDEQQSMLGFGNLDRLGNLMFDFNTLTELSRTHCIALCAVLVPANLIATSLTMLLTALRRPLSQVWQSAGIASIFAVLMLLHVWTWFAIGVVMAPTYILLWLASTCLLTNLGSIIVARRFAGKHSLAAQ